MKYLFLVIAAVLGVAAIGTRLSFPDSTSEVPIIYWVTDSNPARKLQVEYFHQWLKDKGHVNEQGKPVVELRLDTGNRENSKKIIQSVSGVGGDIMDTASGAGLRFFNAMGVLEDVTEDAKRMDFGLDKTWKAMEPELSLVDYETGERRQYMFPCNIGTGVIWSNLTTFERYGITPPGERWTLQDLERIGKQLRDAAKGTEQEGKVYLLPYLDRTVVYRSMGVSLYNETMTACTLADARIVKSMELIERWIKEDRILPSKADLQSFDTQGGYGGPTMQLFKRGNIAMLPIGRWGLIATRKYGAMKLKVHEYPHVEFPNVRTMTRAAAIYKGGKHKELAKLFLAFLADKSYNDLIVDDADAMPPNPAYTKSELFTKPPKYPNEWGTHEAVARILNTVAIPPCNSPYVLSNVATRIERKSAEKFENGLGGAQAMMDEAQRLVNEEIQRNLVDRPDLAQRYKEELAVQAKIDTYRKAGKPVPLSWITNPFYKRYYLAKGWAVAEGVVQ